jgi:hypothetical protein
MIEKEKKGWGHPPPLVAVVIDGNYRQSTALPGYPGWAYYDARYLASFYEEVYDEPLSKMDHMFPPKIGPAGRNVMS